MKPITTRKRRMESSPTASDSLGRREGGPQAALLQKEAKLRHCRSAMGSLGLGAGEEGPAEGRVAKGKVCRRPATAKAGSRQSWQGECEQGECGQVKCGQDECEQGESEQGESEQCESEQGKHREVRRMGSVSEELSLVPLHQRPELLEACAELLREEWGKSRASRLHMLQRSSDAFPICLLLLRSRGPTEIPGPREGPCQLVGHVRLSRVVGRPRDLYVESVVVARALRGQGYGRRLMEATERWARAQGFGCLHLTTHDKQHFYAHLGYVLGEPVQSVAFLSPAISSEVLRLFSAPPGAAITIRPRVPSAPPPPLPPLTVPPPPPPPTVIWARGVLAENSKQSLLKTPHRDAKGLPIFWMKKDI
ncbi:N-alpha-acetyltransferase 80 [Corapipo altera]|uniref:N-alpha-acetyltransferase 80 n=2 Tax=Pipridae TaxID=114313 RepID=UPI000FD6B952|nr:N-alpha-acetyltransferase 80 [Corapipo altera]